MNRTIASAAGDLGKAERIREMNKDRTNWKLSEWSEYFKPADSTHVMSSEEMAAAALWLVDHGYPRPEDCPGRYETEWAHTGGCPVFKPVCLTHNICQMARGLCNDLTNTAYCPTCHRTFSTNNFRDAISREEFRISGMCQACQDRTFGP
jgi:hypothetical protein